MQNIFGQYVATIGTPAAVLVGLALGALITGVIASIKDGTFEWRRVADYLGSMVLAKIGGWLVVATLAYWIKPEFVPAGGQITSTFLTVAATAAYVTVFTAFGGQLLANLAELGVAPDAFERKQ